MITSANIFYVSNFNCIGGVETFIYELSKKYSKYDITILYNTGDIKQIQRIKKYVRMIKYNGEKVKCDRAFFNYETNIIDNIEAKEYIQIIHAMFKTQGIFPRIHPKITKWLCVSNSAGKEYEELTGNKCVMCRNPLTISEEEKRPVLWLISATRLTKEKGKDRIIKFSELLDKSNQPYIWLIFTNDKDEIKNPNIVYMKPRLDVRPFIASIKGKGYGVQLSDCEGDCYFTRECEALGIPLIVTPISSFKEQGLIDGKNCYFVPFDMDNIDINNIINNIPKYEPFQIEDKWEDFIVKKKSIYEEEKKMKVEVKCLKTYYDVELGVIITNSSKDENYIRVIPKQRAEYLSDLGLVEITKVIQEQKKQKAVKPTKKVEKR